MLIRAEIPVDAMKIDRLLRNVFHRNKEADTVQQLREEGLLTLGIVATDDVAGDIIGYAAFSPVSVMGQDLQWVALAPLAVAEHFNHQEIAKQLIHEGMDMLNEFGYAAIVTLGASSFYHQLGFKSAVHHHLYCQSPDTEEKFQFYKLNNGSATEITGLVTYSTPLAYL